MPKNPAEALNDAPLKDVIALLLRQVNRLLAAHQVALADDELPQLALYVADRRARPSRTAKIRAALEAIVNESMGVLQGWGLTYAQALKADMSQIPGWETTAEFLELATEKSNAELRIAAGASLLVAMGDMNYSGYLLDLIIHDAGANDVDAVIARRMLSFASGIDLRTSDWMNRITGWLRYN